MGLLPWCFSPRVPSAVEQGWGCRQGSRRSGAQRAVEEPGWQVTGEGPLLLAAFRAMFLPDIPRAML